MKISKVRGPPFQSRGSSEDNLPGLCMIPHSDSQIVTQIVVCGYQSNYHSTTTPRPREAQRLPKKQPHDFHPDTVDYNIRLRVIIIARQWAC